MRIPTLLALIGCVQVGVQGANFETTAPFYGQKYADVGTPRSLLVDETGDILVVSREHNSIRALAEVQNSDGSVSVNQFVIVEPDDLALNHGLAYFQGFLYASNATNVFRWPYRPGQQSTISVPPQIVVKNIPNLGCCHFTRTLIIDNRAMLYVTVGSAFNIDPTSNRARIRTYNMNQPIPDGGIDFQFGGVYVDGVRNNVGLGFDLNGVLWGVDNGYDGLNRPDLGGDIHLTNPAEELNRYDLPVGSAYGYPYCFTTYNLEGYEVGTQFAMASSMNDGIHTDEWCRNPGNNQPPILSMEAHSAPLGIEFYDGTGCDVVEGAFPCSAIGDAFITYHGSWNTSPKVGYRVSWLKFNNATFEPTGESIDIIFEPNKQTCPTGTCFRPVNAVFNKNGHLIVSADASSEIFKVTYNNPPRPIRI